MELLDKSYLHQTSANLVHLALHMFYTGASFPINHRRITADTNYNLIFLYPPSMRFFHHHRDMPFWLVNRLDQNIFEMMSLLVEWTLFLQWKFMDCTLISFEISLHGQYILFLIFVGSRTLVFTCIDWIENGSTTLCIDGLFRLSLTDEIVWLDFLFPLDDALNVCILSWFHYRSKITDLLVDWFLLFWLNKLLCSYTFALCVQACNDPFVSKDIINFTNKCTKL